MKNIRCEIFEYLDNLKDDILIKEEFYSKFSLEIEKESNKKLTKDDIMVRLYNYFDDYLRDRKNIVFKNEKGYELFREDESKIIYIIKKYGTYISWLGIVSISEERLEEIFQIYNKLIEKHKLENLIERGVIFKQTNEFCLSLLIDFDSENFERGIFEYLEKSIEIEFQNSIIMNYLKLTTKLNISYEKLEVLTKENAKLKEKYETSTLYSISTMGIFLAIFSLISINSTSIYEIMKNENLTSKAGLILLVNGVLLTGVVTLVSLIRSLFEIDSNQNIFSKIGGKAIIIPVILCIIGLILIS